MHQRNEQMHHSTHDIHVIGARALDQWAGIRVLESIDTIQAHAF